MASIRNIGEALLSHIEYNGKTPIKVIKDLIQKHNILLEENANIDMYKKEYYKSEYENARTDNKMLYNVYLKERQNLINDWSNDKSLSKLLDIIKFKRPQFKIIDDIYTYQNIKLDSDKKIIIPNEYDIKPVKPVAKPVVKEVKEVKEVKVKECPDGKILNPVTGRCITDKNLKNKISKIEDVKQDAIILSTPLPVITIEKKKKDCPEGKILNPATGRCITDKTLAKKATKELVKEPKDKKPEEPEEPKELKKTEEPKKPKDCPDGKILNPVTGRCITDKTIAKKVKT
jgi:hypothetical protein